MFHTGPEKEYRALNSACPVHSCDTVESSTHDKSACGDVGSVNGEEETIPEKENREEGVEKEVKEGGKEKEIERETGRDDNEYQHENKSKNNHNKCGNTNKIKDNDRDNYSVNDSCNRISKIKDNIVILPYPFNVLGGVPYYLEDEARYSHKPFVSGCAKEVRKYLGSYIPKQILLPLYCYLSFLQSFVLSFSLCLFH